MRLLLTAAAATALSASMAVAADLPARTAPATFAQVPAFTWTGFYAGAQLGVASQRDRLRETPVVCVGPCVVDNRTGTSTGVIGGVHAGYNFAAAAFVFGLEADFEAAQLSHQTEYVLSAPDSFSSRIKWQGSVRGRLGYAVDRVLLYVTGGLALADIKHGYNLTPPPGFASETFTRIRTGWTLGAGAEYAISRNWSARVEYRYTDFGRRTDVPTIFGGPFAEAHHETQHAGRVGVSYRF